VADAAGVFVHRRRAREDVAIADYKRVAIVVPRGTLAIHDVFEDPKGGRALRQRGGRHGRAVSTTFAASCTAGCKRLASVAGQRRHRPRIVRPVA
jgi:hypothetical protein